MTKDRLDEVLVTLYHQTEELIRAIRFEDLWPGFAPARFALYDQGRCVLGGGPIDQPAAFIGNTALMHEGEYIAIWQVSEALEPAVLAAKLIHEMFHAHQYRQGVVRFPDEREALTRYRRDEIEFSRKAAEERMLATLMDRFDPALYQRFLSHRAARRRRVPYEYDYEAAVEEVEGAAHFVELAALGQLDEHRHRQAMARLKERLNDPTKLVPVRVRCYDVGAALFHVLKRHDRTASELVSEQPTAVRMLAGAEPCRAKIPVDPRIGEVLASDRRETMRRIRQGIDHGVPVAEGEAELLGLNVYDARSLDGYIVSTHFVQYRIDGAEKLLLGDFLIQLNERGEVVRILRYPEPPADEIKAPG